MNGYTSALEFVNASDRVFEAKYFGKSAFGSEVCSDCMQKLCSEDWLYRFEFVEE